MIQSSEGVVMLIMILNDDCYVVMLHECVGDHVDAVCSMWNRHVLMTLRDVK